MELWVLGQQDARREYMRMLAWTQANLINAQIPRGRPKLTVDKLMPKPKREDDERPREDDDEAAPPVDPNLSPRERVRAMGARLRAKERRADARAFWSGAQGRKLAAVLGDK